MVTGDSSVRDEIIVVSWNEASREEMLSSLESGDWVVWSETRYRQIMDHLSLSTASVSLVIDLSINHKGGFRVAESAEKHKRPPQLVFVNAAEHVGKISSCFSNPIVASQQAVRLAFEGF